MFTRICRPTVGLCAFMYLYRKPLHSFINLPCYISHYPICCDLPCRFLHAINLRVLCAHSHSPVFSLINERWVCGATMRPHRTLHGDRVLWRPLIQPPLRIFDPRTLNSSVQAPTTSANRENLLNTQTECLWLIYLPHTHTHTLATLME